MISARHPPGIILLQDASFIADATSQLPNGMTRYRTASRQEQRTLYRAIIGIHGNLDIGTGVQYVLQPDYRRIHLPRDAVRHTARNDDDIQSSILPRMSFLSLLRDSPNISLDSAVRDGVRRRSFPTSIISSNRFKVSCFDLTSNA